MSYALGQTPSADTGTHPTGFIPDIPIINIPPQNQYGRITLGPSDPAIPPFNINTFVSKWFTSWFGLAITGMVVIVLVRRR